MQRTAEEKLGRRPQGQRWLIKSLWANWFISLSIHPPNAHFFASMGIKIELGKVAASKGEPGVATKFIQGAAGKVFQKEVPFGWALKAV